MASVFGNTGNLQVFVEEYEKEKVRTTKRVEEIEKRHKGLKSKVRDDYEAIINLNIGIDKRICKLDFGSTHMFQ